MNKLLLNVRLAACWVQNPLFIVKVSNGEVSRVKGTVRNSFMVDCIDIVKRNEIKYGLIFAVPGQFGKPVLKTTSDISTDARQQLRNTWTNS